MIQIVQSQIVQEIVLLTAIVTDDLVVGPLKLGQRNLANVDYQQSRIYGLGRHGVDFLDGLAHLRLLRSDELVELHPRIVVYPFAYVVGQRAVQGQDVYPVSASGVTEYIDFLVRDGLSVKQYFDSELKHFEILV